MTAIGSLAGVNLSLFDTPVAVPVADCPPAPVDLSLLLTIKRASNGQEILLCTVEPPPASVIAEAGQRGLALFVPSEIDAIRKAAADDHRAVELIIETRRVMGYGGPIEYRRAP